MSSWWQANGDRVIAGVVLGLAVVALLKFIFFM